MPHTTEDELKGLEQGRYFDSCETDCEFGGVWDQRAVYESSQVDKTVRDLISDLREARNENAELSRELIGRTEQYNRALNWATEEHNIVSRIWALFGTPSYEDLKGKSIYDLITDLQKQVRVQQRAYDRMAGAHGIGRLQRQAFLEQAQRELEKQS